jgi:hypothetical protein
MSTSAPTRKRRPAVHLVPTTDPAFFKLRFEGKEIGAVRGYEAGWLPIGGFVFNRGFTTRYFDTKEQAALAVAGVHQKRKELMRGREGSDK